MVQIHEYFLDKTPPTLTCPENITTNTLLGKNYTLVNWTIPTASDNSGVAPNVWTKPDVTFPWNAEIGFHLITYLAQDESGNIVQCQFSVIVTGKLSKRYKLIYQKLNEIKNELKTSFLFLTTFMTE